MTLAGRCVHTHHMTTTQTYRINTALSIYTPDDVAEGASASSVRTETETFDTVDEVISFLNTYGLTEPSVFPLSLIDTNPGVWLTAETYVHPITANREELSAGNADIDDATWIKIVKAVAK